VAALAAMSPSAVDKKCHNDDATVVTSAAATRSSRPEIVARLAHIV